MDYDFRINGVPYHFGLIPKTSKEWDAYTNSSRHSLLQVFAGLTSESKSRGDVIYTIGNSKRVRHGRFKETWLSDLETSVGTLDIRLGVPARRTINLKTYCYDGGTGNSFISARKKTGLFSWKSIPAQRINL